MKAISLLIIIGIAATSCIRPRKPVYPATKKVDSIDIYFDTKIPDPYRWLENDTSDATAAWIEAQNKVTAKYLEAIPFHRKLLKRITTLSDYERIGLPVKKGNKYYFTKNNGLQNQNVMYIQDSLSNNPRIFLNPNRWSDDGTVSLSRISFSKNGKYAACGISRNGSDWQDLYIMDTTTGKFLDDHIQWVKFQEVAWDEKGFYYSAYDAPPKDKELSSVNGNSMIYYHKLKTPQAKDKPIYQNPYYPECNHSGHTSDDGRFLFINNGLLMKDLTQTDAPLVQLANAGYRYSPIGIIDNKIYIFTNYKAPKRRIMVADINSPTLKNWKELIPESDAVLSKAEIIGGKLFLTYNKDASDRAYVYNLNGKQLQEIKLPSLGTVFFCGEKEDKKCFFLFTSFTTPNTIYQYDIDKKEYTLYYAPKIKFNANDFVTEQIFFTSKDSVQIPMFLTYKKGLKKDGNNPVLLYGYGGFGLTLTPSFAIERIPFLENGGIYIQVNLRGGNEYGDSWHKAGVKMQKQNVFDDFISAAEYLIKEKYTNPNKIAITGASNGGLLVGACMTQRPELFRVAVSQVGVMDMLRYHKFTIGASWSTDYGTSSDSKEMFDYLLSYSPLHNLKSGTRYPATLITTADHDDRVVPAHSFKFAATLQAENDGTNPTIIRIDHKAGHGFNKATTKLLKEQADVYAFIMYNLGMKMKN